MFIISKYLDNHVCFAFLFFYGTSFAKRETVLKYGILLRNIECIILDNSC